MSDEKGIPVWTDDTPQGPDGEPEVVEGRSLADLFGGGDDGPEPSPEEQAAEIRTSVAEQLNQGTRVKFPQRDPADETREVILTGTIVGVTSMALPGPMGMMMGSVPAYIINMDNPDDVPAMPMPDGSEPIPYSYTTAAIPRMIVEVIDEEVKS